MNMAEFEMLCASGFAGPEDWSRAAFSDPVPWACVATAERQMLERWLEIPDARC